MKRHYLILMPLLLFASVAHPQQLICISDSVPLNSTIILDTSRLVESPLGYCMKGERVTLLESSESTIAFNKYNPGEKNEVSFKSEYIRVKCPDGSTGWAMKIFFMDYYCPMPSILNGVPPAKNDEMDFHLVGFSKSSIAFVSLGYVDGAVDGLTARFQIIESDTSKIKSFAHTAYTGYDKGLDELWNDHALFIQPELNLHKVDCGHKNVLIRKLNQDSKLHFRLVAQSESIQLFGRKSGHEVLCYTLTGYFDASEVLGWIEHPANKNLVWVVIGIKTASCGRELEVMPVDLFKLR